MSDWLSLAANNPAIAVVASILCGVAAWKALDLGLSLLQRTGTGGRGVIVPLGRLGLRLLLVLCVASAVVSNLSLNVTLPLAVVGVVSIAVTVAAQDTLADVIDGALILIDRPFGVGDRIQIQELQTWGDVLSIGVRSTRIRTLDNGLVVVPNSKIGRGQIVNYSYPDATYRLEANFGVAHGTDIEAVRQLAIASVAQVEYVLPERPIEALVDTLDDSGVRFRLRCWIDSYADFRRARDRVQTRLYQALQAGGIESPTNTASVRLLPASIAQSGELERVA